MNESIFDLSVRAMAHLLYSVAIPDMTVRDKQEHRKQYNAIKRDIAKMLGATYNEVDMCFKMASVNKPFKSMWYNLKELGADDYEV